MPGFAKSLVLILALLLARTAAAHFVWLQALPEEKPTKVCLYFSETTVPGEAKLLDKVAQSKAWLVLPTGKTEDLKLTKHTSGETGGWEVALPADMPAGYTVEATCDYGVFSRGGESFLLQYAARHCNLAGLHDVTPVAKTDKLPLAVTPRWNSTGLELAVTFEGKPATDAELLVVAPDNEERSMKLDASGIAKIENAAPGEYSARASVKLKQPGERDGKPYDQVRHYSTLSFRLPGKTAASSDNKTASSSTTESTAGDPAAAKLLHDARATRAVWENFRGFTCDLSVTIDGQTERGTATVDEHGSATVKLADEKLRDWAEQQVGSLVQHRLPDSPSSERTTFADDQTDHPLGRLISLGDPAYDSKYRIKDNVVTEVNRKAGKMRFTISVLETVWNAEKKYLPRVVSITTWDGDSGEVRSSLSMLNTWTRVGNYDVPERILEVNTGPGKRNVRELVFSNYGLVK